ncbi:MAG: hypothetical protein ACRENX_12790 [Candidatus Dormibacteria bacterium]
MSIAGQPTLETPSRICAPAPLRSLRAWSSAQALGFARTRYNHLVSNSRLALSRALLADSWLAASEGDFKINPWGCEQLAEFEVDVSALHRRQLLGLDLLDACGPRSAIGPGQAGPVTTAMAGRVEGRPRWLRNRGTAGSWRRPWRTVA